MKVLVIVLRGFALAATFYIAGCFDDTSNSSTYCSANGKVCGKSQDSSGTPYYACINSSELNQPPFYYEQVPDGQCESNNAQR